MKSFLTAALVATVSAYSSVDYETAFTKWMSEHNKVYESVELFRRFETFKFNMDFVRDHNEQFANGSESYDVELNKFADLTKGEFKALYLGYKPDLRLTPLTKVEAPDTDVTYPGSLDWTTQGAVTGVKDQGQCGSCWAFSTTGSMEGAIKLAGLPLQSLSEQQLVDCGAPYGNLGCNGGMMDRAFKYAEKYGLCSESAYPYKARGGTCVASSCEAQAGTKLSGYHDVTHTETALGNAIDIGPVSVAIEADQAGFQMYKSGVFTGTCGKNLDHGVLAVGYGTDSGTDYWKVKNSWGQSWGEQGYIRMVRNKDECGIADEPSYPLSGN